jgi:histone H3/H4
MSDFGCEYNIGKNTCKVSKKSLIVDSACVPSITKTGRRSCKTTIRRLREKKVPSAVTESGCEYDIGKNRCLSTKKTSRVADQCIISKTVTGRSSCKLQPSLKKKKSAKRKVAKNITPSLVQPVATPMIHAEESHIRLPTPIPSPLPVVSPMSVAVSRPSIETLSTSYIPELTSFYTANIAFPDNKGQIISLPTNTIEYTIRRVSPFIQTISSGIRDRKSIAEMFETYPKALKDIQRYIKNSQQDALMLSKVTNESTTSFLQGQIERSPSSDESRVFHTLVLNFVIDIINFAHDSASMNKRKTISEKDIDKAIDVEPFFKTFTTSL